MNDTKEKYMGLDINHLFCYGCCHSIGNANFPGGPSGERPCNFCIRNPDVRERISKGDELKVKCWYDSSDAIKTPMDCYHSLDMLDQMKG